MIYAKSPGHHDGRGVKTFWIGRSAGGAPRGLGNFPRREQVTVDFSNAVPEGGRITSLEVPHRMADAILRDSEYDAKKFRDSAGVNVQGTRRRNFRAISGAASLKQGRSGCCWLPTGWIYSEVHHEHMWIVGRAFSRAVDVLLSGGDAPGTTKAPGGMGCPPRRQAHVGGGHSLGRG